MPDLDSIDETNNEPARTSERSVLISRIGTCLILLSCVCWFSLFAIPFLSLSVSQKTIFGGAVFGAVQLFWWSGAALAGPTVIKQMKRWFRRSRHRTHHSEESD